MDALIEVARLADIKYLPGFVMHDINAALVRKVFEFLLQLLHTRNYITLKK